MYSSTDEIQIDLIQRYDDSEFQITYDSFVDTSIPMTIAAGFIALADGLVFLEKEAKLKGSQ